MGLDVLETPTIKPVCLGCRMGLTNGQPEEHAWKKKRCLQQGTIGSILDYANYSMEPYRVSKGRSCDPSHV